MVASMNMLTQKINLINNVVQHVDIIHKIQRDIVWIHALMVLIIIYTILHQTNVFLNVQMSIVIFMEIYVIILVMLVNMHILKMVENVAQIANIM